MAIQAEIQMFDLKKVMKMIEHMSTLKEYEYVSVIPLRYEMLFTSSKQSYSISLLQR